MNDEFFASAMACRMILGLEQEGEGAKRDHAVYSRRSEKSLISQMWKKYFEWLAKKEFLGSGEQKVARLKPKLEPGWMHPAIHGRSGRSGCTPAEPYPPSRGRRSHSSSRNDKRKK